MTPAEIAPFNPHEIWTPQSADFELEEPIERARNEMNRKNPEQLIDSLQKSVEHADNGVAYAILKGSSAQEQSGYSDDEALVVFNPYANAATANMLVRAEFIREVAKFADVRDGAGKLKPIIMLASPGLGGSNVKLSKEELSEVKKGELGPLAKELLKVVSEKEVGKVALLGFSQGADIALAGARKAYAANLDTHSVAVGDPAGVEDRNKVQLGADFMKTGGLKSVVQATGMPIQRQALGFGYGAEDFLFRFIPSAATSGNNRSLWSGLGKNTFESRVQQILDEGVVDRLVVGYGADSSIAKPAMVEPALAKLKAEDHRDILSAIKVEGAKHSWGDQLALLAKLYLRAME